MKKRSARMFAGALLVAAGLAFVKPLALAQEAEVDLALALAIDCSFSVDSNEYQLQMEGLGAALASPEVHEAIQNGPNKKIAISVYQWSDTDDQRVVQPWIVVSTAEEARALGERIARTPRSIPQGGTGISTALIFGAALFNLAPSSLRQVIDVSTDGRNNMGGPAARARDTVVARGITVNGLAVSNEWPTLDIYIENQVAGGPGNFVYKALDYDDFGAVMLKKLVREITGPGMT